MVSSSPFEVSVLDSSTLRVDYSSVKDCLCNPGKVDWSEVMEVPCIWNQEKRSVRTRFGIVFGETQYKLVVHFLDQEVRDFIHLTNYESDFVERRECLSYIGKKEDVPELQDMESVRFQVGLPNNHMQFDMQMPVNKINQSVTDKLAIASHDKPKNSLKSYDIGRGLDVDLVVGGQTIKASEYTLSQYSPVFAAMFANNWEEKEDKKIDIKEFEFEVMNNIIRAIHGIQCNVDVSTALQMLIVADKYQITDIQQPIEDYVKLNITKENVIKTLTIADKLGLEDLKAKALEFISKGDYGKIEDIDEISLASAPVLWMITKTLDTSFLSVKCRKLE